MNILFVVPPIIFTDHVMRSLMVSIRVETDIVKVEDPLIMPSQLHPYFIEEVAAQLGRSSDTERGRQLEKPFVYAVYARYLLAHWQNPDSEWVPLTKVFEGAFQETQKDVLRNYEVNLSGGVHVKDSGLMYADAVPNALTFLGSPAHHDAYMFCRTVDNGVVTWEGAVPLQMRHERPKARDLAGMLWTTRKRPRKPIITSSKKGKSSAKLSTMTTGTVPREAVRLLFCVNQSKCKLLPEKRIVMIAADAMSSTSWMWRMPPMKTGNK